VEPSARTTAKVQPAASLAQTILCVLKVSCQPVEFEPFNCHHKSILYHKKMKSSPTNCKLSRICLCDCNRIGVSVVQCKFSHQKTSTQFAVGFPLSACEESASSKSAHPVQLYTSHVSAISHQPTMLGGIWPRFYRVSVNL
jgi:hypothetical protein